MKTILATLTAVCGLLILGFASLNVLALPDVHFSYSSGECVNVVNYTDEVYTCDNYPSKFHHVWAQ